MTTETQNIARLEALVAATVLESFAEEAELIAERHAGIAREMRGDTIPRAWREGVAQGMGWAANLASEKARAYSASAKEES